MTPGGDLIFGKDQVWFLDLFRKSKDCKQTEFFDKRGVLQEWINLENGARWERHEDGTLYNEGTTIVYGRD